MEPIRINPLTDRLTDLSVKMLQSVADQPNVLISPISALAALAMAQHGAAGNTLAQIDTVLGVSAEEITSAFTKLFTPTHPQDDNSLLSRLDDRTKVEEVKFANAVWIPERPGIRILDSYRQKLSAYPSVEFPEIICIEDACDILNDWVSRQTDGMITNIMSKVPERLALCLLNALAFKSEWKEKYLPEKVYPETFTAESGEKTDAIFLHSTEDTYLEDEYAHGFIKSYSDSRYVFAALVPKEMPLREYIRTLSGEKLQDILENDCDAEVYTATPKFTCEGESDLQKICVKLGIKDAFESRYADFTKMAECADPMQKLYISSFKQKTYLELNEEGTRAVAFSRLDMDDYLCALKEPRYEKVYLDRPFLYMIIDRSIRLPLFIGAVTELEGLNGENVKIIRQNKRILKKALWICPDKTTEEERNYILEMIGEDVELTEFPSSVLVPYEEEESFWCLLMRNCDYIISSLPRRMLLKIWNSLELNDTKYIVDMNALEGETKTIEKSFKRITKKSDIFAD